MKIKFDFQRSLKVSYSYINKSLQRQHAVSSENFRSLSFSGFKVIKKVNNQDHVGKNLSKDNILKVYVAISQKNLSLTKNLTFTFFS